MQLVILILFIIAMIVVYGVMPRQKRKNNTESNEDFLDTDCSGYKNVVVQLSRRWDEPNDAWRKRKRAGIGGELARQIKRYEEHGWEHKNISPNYSRNTNWLNMGSKRDIISYNVLFKKVEKEKHIDNYISNGEDDDGIEDNEFEYYNND